MSFSSLYPFTDPIRLFKENDPYYWEVDNIPLEQLLNNTRYLKDQIEGFTESGGVTRAGFSELKPYVNSVDNVVRVKPGRYTARINDAYNKTPMQKLALVNAVIGGDVRQYQSVFGLSAFDAIVTRAYSDVSTDSLSLNGLAETIYTWRIANPDQHLPTTTLGNYPSTGQNALIDSSPLTYSLPWNRVFTQNVGAFTDLNRLSSEFCKQWRGVARTAIVDVPSELSVAIPAFDPNDFIKIASDGITQQQVPNAVTRIDLVFVYSHPIDTSSTTILKYSNGIPQTITAPVLGIVKGAGAILNKATGANYTAAITRPIDANGNVSILANVADQSNADLGFDTRA